jgi:hypothetical protein
LEVTQSPQWRLTEPYDPYSEWVEGEFIRIRDPFSWFIRAAEFRCQSVLAAGLACWFIRGIKKRDDNLKLTTKKMARFGITTHYTKWRALRRLESVDLIRVNGRVGKNPLVTLRHDQPPPEGVDPAVAALSLRGPIPLNWLSPVCAWGDFASLSTAVALWLQCGLRRTYQDLALYQPALDALGVTRQAKSKALKRFEAAGLARVERGASRPYPVTILLPGQPPSDGGQALGISLATVERQG